MGKKEKMKTTEAFDLTMKTQYVIFKSIFFLVEPFRSTNKIILMHKTNRKWPWINYV
ncbi:hypothetical protein RND71_011275 [Anisodus tanguticus]|uniref:Uncharacterized protein n=1 Tax=Anisodus tanguticus TaxID=243964 RepID=A0AAE1SB84_9SOLA|nr:hypothetical protein RND71_011275 [Anisodus tanguticus]